MDVDIRFSSSSVHSAVLPYLLLLPLFWNLGVGRRLAQKCRGGWKSAFLINFIESLSTKFRGRGCRRVTMHNEKLLRGVIINVFQDVKLIFSIFELL